MTLEQIILIVLAGFGAWIFWRQLAIREMALQHANAACSRADVQLLDQSIGLSKLRLSKLSGGGFGVLREYHFEFTSTGERRYVGCVFMIGQTLQRVQMDAFREPV
jgi:ABC-type nickel/cobalt efflux system permease component RcnA